jgi:hypothetical protein
MDRKILFITFICFICAVIISAVGSPPKEEKLQPGDTSFTQNAEKTHIVFLLDSSSSITVDDWGLMKHIMNVVC